MLTSTQLQGVLPAGVVNVNASLRLNINQDGLPPVKKDKEEVFTHYMPAFFSLIKHDQILLEPYEYLCAHPGKDVRTKMIAAFNVWLQVPPEQLQIITKVITMLHSASLL